MKPEPFDPTRALEARIALLDTAGRALAALVAGLDVPGGTSAPGVPLGAVPDVARRAPGRAADRSGGREARDVEDRLDAIEAALRGVLDRLSSLEE